MHQQTRRPAHRTDLRAKPPRRHLRQSSRNRPHPLWLGVVL